MGGKKKGHPWREGKSGMKEGGEKGGAGKSQGGRINAAFPGYR